MVLLVASPYLNFFKYHDTSKISHVIQIRNEGPPAAPKQYRNSIRTFGIRDIDCVA
jgi:hypothetical protein